MNAAGWGRTVDLTVATQRLSHKPSLSAVYTSRVWRKVTPLKTWSGPASGG